MRRSAAKVLLPVVTQNSLDQSILLTYGKPLCSLIWLHGLGATADNFTSFFTHSDSPLYEGLRVKMIQAPAKSITVNEGISCPSWYNMRSFDRFTAPEEEVFDLHDVEASNQIIDAHFKQEMAHWSSVETKDDSGVPPFHRVFVGGFSQGGVMALHYGLQADPIPAGVVSMSGYLLKHSLRSNFRKIPVCLMHGSRDQVIWEKDAHRSYEDILKDENLVDYHNFERLDHSVSLQQLSVLGQWLAEVNSFLARHYSRKSE